HELTRDARRHEDESVLERFDHLRSTVTQEHLAAASLPAHVVRVVDISDQVRLFKSDDVPVFIRAHLRLPLTTLPPDLLSHRLSGSRPRQFSSRPTRVRPNR